MFDVRYVLKMPLRFKFVLLPILIRIGARRDEVQTWFTYLLKNDLQIGTCCIAFLAWAMESGTSAQTGILMMGGFIWRLYKSKRQLKSHLQCICVNKTVLLNNKGINWKYAHNNGKSRGNCAVRTHALWHFCTILCKLEMHALDQTSCGDIYS